MKMLARISKLLQRKPVLTAGDGAGVGRVIPTLLGGCDRRVRDLMAEPMPEGESPTAGRASSEA